ncbi:MAG: serine/threonine protein kinase [Planctomycetota bacterium]|nr:MAG: serine/threonine protein kinase [Planctomycetota bacterium]
MPAGDLASRPSPLPEGLSWPLPTAARRRFLASPCAATDGPWRWGSAGASWSSTRRPVAASQCTGASLAPCVPWPTGKATPSSSSPPCREAKRSGPPLCSSSPSPPATARPCRPRSTGWATPAQPPAAREAGGWATAAGASPSSPRARSGTPSSPRTTPRKSTPNSTPPTGGRSSSSRRCPEASRSASAATSPPATRSTCGTPSGNSSPGPATTPRVRTATRPWLRAVASSRSPPADRASRVAWSSGRCPHPDGREDPPAGPHARRAARLRSVRWGAFRIEGRLGAGSMGEVYAARDATGRPVAIKRLSGVGRLDAEALARFRREAEATARLNHPGVVRIHSFGAHEGLPYFVMEYVPGESLAARLERGALPAAEAARLVASVARAVAHAHERGILHRDLKPANVLLRAQDGAPVLTDFGLARDLRDRAERLTRTGQTLGTPAAMAPEQADGQREAIGPRTDVYGLGALLYAALTGRLPFAGGSLAKVLRRVLFEPPPPPRSVAPEVPAELEAVCLRCLAKAPEDRYEGAAALAEDLDRYLRGEPTWAGAQRPPFARRRARLALALLPALLAPLGAVGYLSLRPAARAPGGETARPRAPSPSPSALPQPAEAQSAPEALAPPELTERLLDRKPQELRHPYACCALFLSDDLLIVSASEQGGLRAFGRSEDDAWSEQAHLANPDRALALFRAGAEEVVFFSGQALWRWRVGAETARRVLDLRRWQDDSRWDVKLACAVHPVHPERVAFGCGRRVLLVDLDRGEAIAQAPAQGLYPNAVHALAWSADGARLLVGYGATPTEWAKDRKQSPNHTPPCGLDLREGRELRRVRRRDLLGRPESLLAAAEGAWWVGTSGGLLLRFPAELGEPNRLTAEGLHPEAAASASDAARAHSAGIRALARSPSGQLVSTSSAKGKSGIPAHLHVWTAAGSPAFCRVLGMRKLPRGAAAFAPRGAWLALAQTPLHTRANGGVGLDGARAAAWVYDLRPRRR